jgi:hypothetical protein
MQNVDEVTKQAHQLNFKRLTRYDELPLSPIHPRRLLLLFSLQSLKTMKIDIIKFSIVSHSSPLPPLNLECPFQSFSPLSLLLLSSHFFPNVSIHLSACQCPHTHTAPSPAAAALFFLWLILSNSFPICQLNSLIWGSVKAPSFPCAAGAPIMLHS